MNIEIRIKKKKCVECLILPSSPRPPRPTCTDWVSPGLPWVSPGSPLALPLALVQAVRKVAAVHVAAVTYACP